MSGTLAQTIQGEAGGNPANQFAVASVIYNRMKAGTFPGGSDPVAIVNAPSQFTGQAAPNASAQQLADAIQLGTLPQYGNTGNAVNFGDASIRATSAGVNIGGNYFSDNWGPPTANFVPPQYGATSNAGTNFTAPAGTPDGFVVSDTPGSQSEHPINPGDYSSDPGASFEFNDPGAAAGGAGTLGPGNGGGSGSSRAGGGGSANPQGVEAGSGAGQPVQLNLGPQTAKDFQSYVTAPITAFEGWATTQFAQLSNWFSRGFLILLAIVIILVALWKATGSPNVSEMAKVA